jgi:CheY-like chemotaxis protein
MPRMDGYELLAAVRADAVYQDIPVVMLTSRAHDKHRQKALGLGAAGYLVKPYDEEALLRTLSEVSGRRAVAGAIS